MSLDASKPGGGPSAGPLPSRPAIPPGDRATYPSHEGPILRVRQLAVRLCREYAAEAEATAAAKAEVAG